MSTLVTVFGLVVGGGLTGAGLMVILTGYAPDSDVPVPSRVVGSMFLFPGLGLLLIQGMRNGSGVLALLCGLAGFACFGIVGWLSLRYPPLVFARGRSRGR
jgi:hypothetical protein